MADCDYTGWTVVKFSGGSVLLDSPSGSRRRVSLEPEIDRLTTDIERYKAALRLTGYRLADPSSSEGTVGIVKIGSEKW